MVTSFTPQMTAEWPDMFIWDCFYDLWPDRFFIQIMWNMTVLSTSMTEPLICLIFIQVADRGAIYILMMMLWHHWGARSCTTTTRQVNCDWKWIVCSWSGHQCHNIIIDIYIAGRSTTWIRIKHVKGSVIDVDKTVIFHMIRAWYCGSVFVAMFVRW